MGGEELGSEPALDDRLGDGGAAAGPHRRGAVGPGRCGWQCGAGAEQGEPVDPVGVAGRDPHRRHAAERQPDEMGPPDAEPVEQGDEVVGQVVDRVGPVGDRGVTVAAGVVANHPEPLLERGELGVPHRGGWTRANWRGRRPGRPRGR